MCIVCFVYVCCLRAATLFRSSSSHYETCYSVRADPCACSALGACEYDRSPIVRIKQLEPMQRLSLIPPAGQAQEQDSIIAQSHATLLMPAMQLVCNLSRHLYIGFSSMSTEYK